jgi:hypothetical protein
MTERFLDRERELATLQQIWDEPSASLTLVWGRRRAGKTRLLGRFAEGRRAVYHGATQQALGAELAAFSATVRDALPPSPTDVLAHGDLPSWGSALEYLGERAATERLLVVLDEFPYLTATDPSLPSVLQRFWDQRGRRGRLMLVLCGSAQAAMLELRSSNAPLFGRIDRTIHVRPFEPEDAALFLPRLAAAERAIAYGIVGGMPAYLSRWRDDLGHVANLRRLFGDPSSALVGEGEFVLTSELPEAAGYFRILHAIASGHRTFNAIRSFADIDIKRQLDRLVLLGLVVREVPITEDPTRSKRVVYRIGDNFLNFWFRFVYRKRADIERGLGREVVDRVVLPALSDHMGEPWEEMCRGFLRRRAAQGMLPVAVSTIGRWWNRDHSVEIDVVGLDDRRVVLAGSVKWGAAAGGRELARLRNAVEALPNRSDDLHLVLFARQRVEAVGDDRVLRFTAEDVLGPP